MRNGVTFVSAETGGGKGVFSVIQIVEYLSEGRRVATNMDLYLESFSPESNQYPVHRLPDKPTRTHLMDMGYGSIEEDKNKHNYGLLVLDEIPLFLDTKRSKEFLGIYRWFLQRRKFHWDILFICQNYLQVQEEFYKSLCNFLVVCEEKDLYPIPYVGTLLRSFGFSGNLSDGHYFYKYRGKSEAAILVDDGEFENLPYRDHYNTDQFFDEGLEFLGDELVDMRASYSLIPAKYLANIIEQKPLLLDNQEEGGDMARPNKQGGLKLKMKLVFLFFVVLIAGYQFSQRGNDSDEASAVDSKLSSPLKPESSAVFISERNLTVSDSLIALFDGYHARLSSYVALDGGYFGYIEFYDRATITFYRRVNLRDFIENGFNFLKYSGGVVLKNEDREFFVTTSLPDPALVQESF